jgi:hypothetical protein
VIVLSVEDIISKFSPEAIKQAAHKLEIEERISKILKDSRWKDTPILQDKNTFILPLLDYGDRRPLAVTLHSYGLYIEPIYVAYKGGKPDKDFALHIDEEDDGLYMHIEDVLSMTLSGSYDLGFKLEITEKDEKTQIIDTTPKHR